MSYKPKPIDTSHIKPDESIRRLAEKLARNVHERWALGRVQEGWTYGPNRDDEQKKHPGLVEYDELPESEKDYDRVTAMETIKCILSLGYRIEPPSLDSEGAMDDELASILKALRSPDRMSLSKLQSVWRDHDPEKWASHPSVYRYLAERVIRLGEALLCYDVVSAGLEHFPSNVDLRLLEEGPRDHYVRLRQLLGLCLAQSGATSRACKVLTLLREQGQNDGETLGILARTHKDMAIRTGDQARRMAELNAARGIYLEAFNTCKDHQDIDGASYNGINAASLALLCGLREEARELAAEVNDLCSLQLSQLREKGKEPHYWTLATLGEASLLLNDWDAARTWYGMAAENGTDQLRDISSMRRQARLLSERLTGDAHRLDDCFPVPAVVVFASNGFGAGLGNYAEPTSGWLDYFERELSLWREGSGEGIAYCCCFSPAELVFCELMLKSGVRLNLVLPCAVRQFRDDYVGSKFGEGWKDRFERIVSGEARVYPLSDRNDPGDPTNVDFTYRVLDGLATLRARRLDTQMRFLFFSDDGGSADKSPAQRLFEQWRGQGKTVQTLGSEVGVNKEETSAPHPLGQRLAEPRDQHGAEPARRISAMLFADIKHYSRLDESQQLRFGQSFLPRVARLVGPHEERVMLTKTAGDGLFIVLDDAISAGSLALALRDEVAVMDWERFGLPKGIGIRISLDAGPVYTYTDPISRALDVCGSYVVRAARIEPITPPGQVYASESFAALAAHEGSGEFEFEYAGRIPLPKGFGIAPVYHVRREEAGT
ncbi:MAG: hypothetical protein JW759_00165 [Candidatus Coatesbacteria bacterium]|nr:hypothetical protein [Candidatus Coatesbacteria bacterium]